MVVVNASNYYLELKLIVSSRAAADEGATETQTAQCTITSGDVKASAQASVTTRLDGVCETSKWCPTTKFPELDEMRRSPLSFQVP